MIDHGVIDWLLAGRASPVDDCDDSHRPEPGGAHTARVELRSSRRAAPRPDPRLRERLLELPAGDLVDECYEALVDGHATRKVFAFDCFQMPARPETVRRRCEVLRAMSPGSVLLLGDDDLVSLGLHRLGIPVEVGDIDEHLLGLLRGLAPSVGRHFLDVRAPLSPDLAGRFDVVMGDPMSTYPGVRAFLRTALAALAPKGTILLFGHPRLRIVFDHVRDELGLELRSRRVDFSAYYSPKTLASLDDRKDLYELGRP